MGPEYLYYAFMVFGALPLAWFRKDALAAVVFATWAVGQAAYELGAPEPETQFVLYLIAFGIALRFARSAVDLFAAVLFFPLALTCSCEIAGIINPTQAWWTIYWIALTQAASLPFNTDWHALWLSWRAKARGGGGTGMHHFVHT